MNGAAFAAVARHALTRGADEAFGLVRLSLAPLEGEGDGERRRRLRDAAGAVVSATRGEDVLGRTDALELCALLPGLAPAETGLVASRLALPGASVSWSHGTCEEDASAGLDGLLARARGTWLAAGSSSPSSRR